MKTILAIDLGKSKSVFCKMDRIIKGTRNRFGAGNDREGAPH